MNIAAELPPEIARLRILDVRETANFIGVSIPTLRRMYRAKTFPKPVTLNERTYGWQVGTIAEWLQQKAEKQAA